MRWQHFDELEADFQQYFGLNVAFVKPARAARLMYQLPKTSRLFSAINPAMQWGWREILANKANYLLDTIIWQNSNEGVKKHKQTPHPKIFVPDFMKKAMGDEGIKKDTVALDVDEVKHLLSRPRK